MEAKKLKYIASTLKGLYNVYSGTADLSIYFNELGFRLLADGGIISFITTNKFLNTKYGEQVRKLLSSQRINILLNFEQVEVFEKILVSSVIFIVSKSPCGLGNQFVYEKFYKLKCNEFKQLFTIKQNTLGYYPQDYLDEREWSFADLTLLRLKTKIEASGLLIKKMEGVHVYRGVTTGYNPAFIISEQERNELITKDTMSAKIIKKMLQGRNIRKWYYNESDEYLIFTRRGIDIDEYPSIKEHLFQFYDQLKPKNRSIDTEGRKPGVYKWYEILDNTAYYQHFEKSEKIIWGLTADKWAYTLDTEQHYLPSNGYILTSDIIPIRFILGMLNSKVLHHYFSYIGVMTAGGAYTLKAASIEALPIPTATLTQQRDVINLVDNVLSAKKQNPQADTSVIEAEIDKLAYKLYGLTDDEIKIVEET
ncbi:MAG: restriction endonuclease [Clostridia bacterium]|nr:restriction endonuclease [Clostridia bacterium]